MRITVREAGEYFRGLLLLARADHRITHQEREMLERVGRALGLERDFCRRAMREILDNPWVEVSPPYFSNRALAEVFLRDGLKMASRDGSIHASELAWLQSVAEVNGIDRVWLLQEKASAFASPDPDGRLGVERLSLSHTEG